VKSDPIPESWRQEYLKRPVAKLPGDLVKAYDELRAQRRDIDHLRAQLWRSQLKVLALASVLGGAAAKGIEVAFIAAIKLLPHLVR
jgi:hypothetical protein